jgi:hypothetical protein
MRPEIGTAVLPKRCRAAAGGPAGAVNGLLFQRWLEFTYCSESGGKARSATQSICENIVTSKLSGSNTSQALRSETVTPALQLKRCSLRQTPRAHQATVRSSGPGQNHLMVIQHAR